MMSDIATSTCAGSRLYLDGRFYDCISRVPTDRNAMNDIIVLQRIMLSGSAVMSTAHTCFASDLDEAELAGRAVLIARDRPDADTSQPTPSSPLLPSGAAVRHAQELVPAI